MSDEIALRRVVVVHELDEGGLDDRDSDAREARAPRGRVEEIGDVGRGRQKGHELPRQTDRGSKSVQLAGEGQSPRKKTPKGGTDLVQLGKDVVQLLVLQVPHVRDEPSYVASEVHHARVADLPRFSIRDVRLFQAGCPTDGDRNQPKAEKERTGSSKRGRAAGPTHLEDLGDVRECTAVDIVFCKVGQLNQNRDHDGRDIVDHVLQVRARVVREVSRRCLRRRPRVLGLFEKVVNLLRDLGDHAVLRLLERLLERRERVEVDRTPSLGGPTVCHLFSFNGTTDDGANERKEFLMMRTSE